MWAFKFGHDGAGMKKRVNAPSRHRAHDFRPQIFFLDLLFFLGLKKKWRIDKKKRTLIKPIKLWGCLQVRNWHWPQGMRRVAAAAWHWKVALICRMTLGLFVPPGMLPGISDAILMVNRSRSSQSLSNARCCEHWQCCQWWDVVTRSRYCLEHK